MNKTITVPAALLERVRELPGTAGMEDSQLISRFLKAGLAAAEREEISAARSTLLKILSVLSDDALVCVWRPIMYAYLWTDFHDHDRLTDDDMCRIHLSGVIAHGSPELVERLDKWRHALESAMGKEALA